MSGQSLPRIMIIIVGLIFGFSLVFTPTANAGIYNANGEVTYKEYWVPHGEFTGGVALGADGKPIEPCQDQYPNGGSWYLEAWGVCSKTMTFYIPDDFSDAKKIEIYIDLWRNRAKMSARFSLNQNVNGIPANEYWPKVGADWSRTPYVGEIDPSHLKQGANTITFWVESGANHIHDLSFRIYFDDANPLRAPGGAAIQAPDGQLLTVGGKAASAGGTLNVNSDSLTLVGETTSAADFIEFHGYYDGYDEDNDGVFRDWHNRNRNNWNPGGLGPLAKGGTIDHIGTVLTSSPGNHSINWNLEHVPNQSGVRFKTRIVREVTESNGLVNHVVREAAGGVSAEFALVRDRPVMGFIVDRFRDFVLCHKNGEGDSGTVCTWPELVDVTMDLPVNPSQFDKSYFLGSYWEKPKFAVNGSSDFSVFNGQDKWEVGIQQVSPSLYTLGENTISYIYTSGFGQFVEYPGPLVVLAKTSSSSDNAPPTATLVTPKSSQGVSVDTEIVFILSEQDGQLGYGVDVTSIQMRVDGQVVQPQITGFSNLYTLSYQPPAPFPYDTNVTVDIEASDLAGNQLSRQSRTFRTQLTDMPLGATSDDFNECTLDTAVWTWIDPQAGMAGESSYRMTGSTFEISVPGGTDHDVWDEGNRAPRLMQTVNNDPFFEIQVKFASDLGARYQFQGVLIEQDEDNYLRINFQHDGSRASLLAAKIVDGVPSQFWNQTLSPPDGQGPMYMRIQRNGSNWSVAYNFDGFFDPSDSNFTFNHVLIMNKMGVFAGNAGDNPPFTAEVDYFFDMDAPISPQDPQILSFEDLALALVSEPVSAPGFGQVNGAPQNPTPGNATCGSPLRLTAVPADGWQFERWKVDTAGGLVESVDNPLVRAFVNGESVQALFKQLLVDLDVNVVNNGILPGGSVNVDPDKEFYNPNDVVELSAQTPPGWQFDGWSGDLSGVNPVESLTMTDSKAVTATFTQLQYALSVSAAGAGNGIVAVDPVKEHYLYGDMVRVRAIKAMDGSLFGGWSGDLPDGADPMNEELDIFMDRDRSLVAEFTLSHGLTTAKQGEGEILVAPDKSAYAHNEVVTLTVEAATCWVFGRWEGDLSGNANPATLTMDGDKSVTAIFVPAAYEISLDVDGEGAATKTPDNATYACQEQVTLQATPAAIWQFSHWSSSASALDGVTSSQVTVTMTDNITATAHFVMNDNFIYLPTVRR